MKEAKSRLQLKKLLLDENLVVIERAVINDRTEYKEVSKEIRNFLIEQIKGLDITYYYIEEKANIPAKVETAIPENVTWN